MIIDYIRIALDVVTLCACAIVSRRVLAMATDCALSLKVIAITAEAHQSALQHANALVVDNHDVLRTIEAAVTDVDIPVSYMTISDAGEN